MTLILTRLYLVAIVATASYAGTASAQPARTPPSEHDIVNALDPPGWRARPPGMRSWGGPVLSGGERGIVVEGREAESARPTIDLHIPFVFDSAALTPEGQVMLGTLGQAMNAPRLADIRVRIVGHTDARGSEDYNQALSERRAMAVRDYLIRAFGIASSRLEATGRGERELRDPANPEADVNRRVQVINIGG